MGLPRIRPSASSVITSYSIHYTKLYDQALKAVTLDRIVFETDTPDIVPQFILDAHPGEVPLNQPANVPEIVRVAAERKGMAFETLARHGYDNSLDLFGPILKEKNR